MQIAIASGKGGTGKTFFATNFAYSLSQITKVQLVDCDVEEPNAHLFLPISVRSVEKVKAINPIIDNEKCNGCGLCAKRCLYNALSIIKNKVLFYSELCHSCGGCILFCPENAIKEGKKIIGEIEYGVFDEIEVFKGKLSIGATLAPEVIHTVISKSNRDKTVVIDAPPGTSCSAVATVQNVDYCILVTEPTPYGLHDLKLAVNMTKALNVPFGVVINKDENDFKETDAYCAKNNIPILLRIPYSKSIATAYAEGYLYCKENQEYQEVFRSVLQKVKRVISNA